jgi:hypothetical protein
MHRIVKVAPPYVAGEERRRATVSRAKRPDSPARGRTTSVACHSVWTRLSATARLKNGGVDYVGELTGFWAWKSMIPPLSQSQATAS